MYSIKRPKPSETEEDILKQEEEFLKNHKAQKVIPAATAANKFGKVIIESSGNSRSETIGSHHQDDDDDKQQPETIKVNTGNDESCCMHVDKEGYDDDNDDDKEGAGKLEYPPDETILFQVKERLFDPSKLKEFRRGHNNKAPPVLKVKLSTSTTGNDDNNTASAAGGPPKRKKSLFAKKFDKEEEEEERRRIIIGNDDDEGQRTTPTQQSKVHDKCQSHHQQDYCGGVMMMTATEEEEVIGDKVHPLLSGMTSKEILQEQKKLLERLDPKLVEFIRNRQSHSQSLRRSIQQEDTQRNEELLVEGQISNKNNCFKEEDLPIPPESVKGIPGMDKVELSKLAWAGLLSSSSSGGGRGDHHHNNQPSSTNEGQDEEGKSARFDFAGMLLPTNVDASTDPSTLTKALHHHGEEMERPGYTIEELLTLARSANLQQRSIGLETLGNVFALAHTGVYDDVLEKSVFMMMEDYGGGRLVHVVRKGLDHTDSQSVNSALACLASLVYVEHEECALDATYLWPGAKPYPLLLITKNEDEEKDTMKDIEVLQVDLLDWLVRRSDLLVRLEYLISDRSESFNENGVVSMLKILIRIARHSPDAVMMGHEKMLRYIAEQHVSPNWVLLRERQRTLKGVPLVHALKLFRVLIESNVTNAMKIYHNFRILPSVMGYLAYDQWREQTHIHEIEDLIIESFRIWQSFLSLGIAIDEYASFFPVLMQFLHFYRVAESFNSFDLHHSAYLFALFSQIVRFGEEEEEESGGKREEGDDDNNKHSHWELVKGGFSLIEGYCFKIMRVLSATHLRGSYNLDLALLSLGKGLEFLQLCTVYPGINDQLSSRFTVALKQFVQSQNYLHLISNLNSRSSVIFENNSSKNSCSRYSSNFSTIGAVRWKGELNPVIRSNSPFYFLSCFIPFCKSVLLLDDSTTTTSAAAAADVAFDLLFNEEFKKYFERCGCGGGGGGEDSNDKGIDYFARFEMTFIAELLTVIPIDFPQRFSAAYRSLSKVPVCSPKLFQRILHTCLESCCKKPGDLQAVFQFYIAYFELSSVAQGIIIKKSEQVSFDDDDGGGGGGDGKKKKHNAAVERKILFDDQWCTPRTETHWMFHPLENLYRKAVTIPGFVRDNLGVLEEEVRGSLSFIRECLEWGVEGIVRSEEDIVTVYCRVCRVFMLGCPDIYIDEITRPILQSILGILATRTLLNTKKSASTIFSQQRRKSGSSRNAAGAAVTTTFYEFYLDLVGEYFDNSYFDETFAGFLCLPLRGGEQREVKMCFWGHEQLGFVRLGGDKIPIPLLEYLTETPEKDQKMLSTYMRLIKRKIITPERNPLIYKVAAEQLRNSQEFMSEEELRRDFGSLLKIFK